MKAELAIVDKKVPCKVNTHGNANCGPITKYAAASLKNGKPTGCLRWLLTDIQDCRIY